MRRRDVLLGILLGLLIGWLLSWGFFGSDHRGISALPWLQNDFKGQKK